MSTTQKELETAHELLDFIRKSPTAYQAVANMRDMLDAKGFIYLPEQDAWDVRRGGCYYTTRNASSIVAFKVGADLDHYHYQMSASHTDSPTFKVKMSPELSGPEGYLRLNVEPYGGMIDYTWFDRPLSVAGRVMVREGSGVRSRLLAIDRDLFLIPSLAIHMNREVNDGFAPNRQVDLMPLMSAGELSGGAFVQLLADELGVEADQVLSFDLTLVNRQPGVVWGAREEFVSSPRLDDLQSAFSALRGFDQAHNDHDVSVFACFDNEEVGSGTKQGAKSTFLRDVLVRINAALGKDEQDLLRALAASFMVSFDNAHAVHPNHPEHADEGNRPHLNQGVVIKEHAAQLYCTDAFSSAVMAEVCRRADVPTQVFANRSDKRGGSTLGNLSNQQVSVHGVDIGLPQLAMHSSYETAGVRDTAWGIRALEAFYGADLVIEGAEGVSFCS